MFSSIATMNVGRCQLVVNGVSCHVLLQGSGGFIVKTLELRVETSLGKKNDSALVCSNNVMALATFHQFCMDVVAVIIIQNKQVGVAGSRRDKEAASFITVNVASMLLTVSIKMVTEEDWW